MSILIVGSAAYDTIETPFGKADKVIGGSSLYSSVSASFFHPVNLVSVVGKDFPENEIEFLKSKKIDVSGLSIMDGKTFSWEGSYGYDLGEATTKTTNLNVFEEFKPNIPENFKNSEYVFLANIDPNLQIDVLKQVKNPKLIAMDTMNFWIENKKEALIEAIKLVNIVLINDSEARQLTEKLNLLKAAKKILTMGPQYVIIKRGEYGVVFFEKNHIFSLPAFPLETVKDPTGAGDSFAGGFIGYLAKLGDTSQKNIRKAVVMGTVMASINVEDFSLNRFKKISEKDIDQRLKDFKKILHFDEIE